MNPQLFWTLPGLIDILARANADGTGQETLLNNTQLNNPNGIALDLENGHVYIVDGGAGDQILRVSLDGSDLQVIVANAGDNPADIALDLVNGQIYWTIPGITDQVRRANLDGSNVETVLDSTVLNNPNGIAVDMVNGHIYIADGGAGDRILRTNLDGSNLQVIVADAGDNPADLALDLQNGQIYWSIPGTTDEVRRADLDGSNIETILDTSLLENPNGLALDVEAGQLYIADGGAGDVILRANLDGSNPEVLPIDAGDNPTGLAIAAENSVLDPIQVSVFAEPDTPLSEAEQTPGAFIFRLSAPAPAGGLTIGFQAADTDPDSDSQDVTIGDPGTTNIDDFTIRPIPGFTSTVTVSEGATEARLVVTPFPDDLAEDTEVISLSLLPGANYTVDTANALAELTIIESFPMTTQNVTVSIENLSPDNGAFLTPLWFGFHDGTFDTYDRGRPVSPGLESLAEDGATELISQEFDLAGFGTVQGTILGLDDTPGPIDPGEVATFTVELDPNDPGSRFFNYASMVIPSNDFFIANGNERAHAIFDEAGNFIGADFIVFGNQVLDAGSEIDDEIPANTAFFGQIAPNTGVDENGVVVLAEGFIPGGPILSDPRFANADFTASDFQVARIRVFLENLVEPAPGAKFVIDRGEINQTGIELLNDGDSLKLLGRIETLGTVPGVLTQAQDNRIYIAHSGAIDSETTAIQVNGVDTDIENLGLIDGGFNGINLANDDTASATILNRGTIVSDSRAVNIGGVGGSLVNYGQILSSDRPRNGTVYGDVTALNVDIENHGLIDVGAGLDGDAVSLELGAQVDGQVVNYGLIQGRGLPLDGNQAAAVRLYWVSGAGPTSTFNGNVENFGHLAAENGPAVIVEENTILNGDLINYGLISSPNPDNGIGVRIEGEVTGEIINRGEINGGRDGIDIANGGTAIATIVNTGLISSTSRAVNLGGAENRLINEGLITTTANPRNGTVYGDVTALNIEIENHGLIDVGAGLDGDAVSLELGAQVDGQVVNYGLIQGRGLPLDGNQAAAVRLYWVPGAGPTSTFNGNVENFGHLAAENGPAVIVEENTILNGDLINYGLISSPNPDNGIGVRIEGEVTGEIINRGEINGGRDGIDIANGGTAIATIVNTGLISSTSRAVNLGGAENRLINEGLITTTANPRNGTVYGDITALNIEIENHGLIDVGHGLDGDAVSLELGSFVTGTIVNTGSIQGRGSVLGNNQAAAIRLFQPGGEGAPVAVFQGDIDNQGLLAAEQEAAIVIQTGTQLAGSILNSGLIEGGESDTAPSGYLAIDGREAAGDLTVINTGTIVGVVLLSDGDDLFIGTGGTVNGVVQGNGGNDSLIGGAGDDSLYGGDGDDILEGGLGSDVKTGGLGADTFRFGADLIASNGSDMDVITDFEAIDRIDFSGFLGAGGEFSLAVLSDRLIANLSTGDTVTVLGDLTAASAQLTPLATAVAIA